MGFGDTIQEEIKDTIANKLDKWFNSPPDYDDVEQAYKERGKLQSQKVALLRDIESIEDEILADEDNKPRSNETRIKKLKATKEHRDHLAYIESQIAENENKVRFLEFRRAMFSSAVFRIKIQMEL